MSARVKHADWAEAFIKDAQLPFDPNEISQPDRDATVAENLAFAQVHATLALVEQQRTANLLEYSRVIAEGGFEADHEEVLRWAGLEIREALGLTR